MSAKEAQRVQVLCLYSGHSHVNIASLCLDIISMKITNIKYRHHGEISPVFHCQSVYCQCTSLLFLNLGFYTLVLLSWPLKRMSAALEDLWPTKPKRPPRRFSGCRHNSEQPTPQWMLWTWPPFHVPNLPRNAQEIHTGWDLLQTLSVDPHSMFDQVCQAGSPATWSNSPFGGDRLTALLLSSPECPSHTPPDRMTWPKVCLWITLCCDRSCPVTKHHSDWDWEGHSFLAHMSFTVPQQIDGVSQHYPFQGLTQRHQEGQILWQLSLTN